ncbi:MAG: hypothetical protein ACRCRW_00220 [Aeromonadaceae bacterium]
MTLDELHALYLRKQVKKAVIAFDALSGGWVVEFQGAFGLAPLTDAKGCRVTFAHELAAEEAISWVGECPIHIEDEQRHHET